MDGTRGEGFFFPLQLAVICLKKKEIKKISFNVFERWHMPLGIIVPFHRQVESRFVPLHIQLCEKAERLVGKPCFQPCLIVLFACIDKTATHTGSVTDTESSVTRVMLIRLSGSLTCTLHSLLPSQLNPVHASLVGGPGAVLTGVQLYCQTHHQCVPLQASLKPHLWRKSRRRS